MVSRKKIMLHRSGVGNEKRKILSITLICLTFAFLIMTAPVAFSCTLFAFISLFIFYNRLLIIVLIIGFFQHQLLSTKSGQTFIWVINAITFSYHGSNFLILYFINKAFKKEFKKMIINKKLTQLCYIDQKNKNELSSHAKQNKNAFLNNNKKYSISY